MFSKRITVTINQYLILRTRTGIFDLLSCIYLYIVGTAGLLVVVRAKGCSSGIVCG